MELVIGALAPVVVIILYVYLRDKYEKEPKTLMIYCFLLGGIFSIFLTSVIYQVYSEISLDFDDSTDVVLQFVNAFFIVALTEEFSKYVIVRYYAQPKNAFNEPYDGIVYALMVSMGFAAVENIFYVFEGGLKVALLRALTAVPAHATFGILMGYFMGLAKFSDKRVKHNLTGLLLAVLFHGAYDFFLFINFIPGVWIGALISLIAGIYLSRRAIKQHQKNSHFKEGFEE